MSLSPISPIARNLAKHIHVHVANMLLTAKPPVLAQVSGEGVDHHIELLALQIELTLTGMRLDALKRQCSPPPASSSPSPASCSADV